MKNTVKVEIIRGIVNKQGRPDSKFFQTKHRVIFQKVGEKCESFVNNGLNWPYCGGWMKTTEMIPRNRPLATRIIKGLRSARMPRREAAKDSGKIPVQRKAQKSPSRVLSRKKP
ncbi:hypothetical protein M9H77_18298 [Catharanthus roseus]|uniref:Uncharacterized protein n=1 Tax=Catharanthus roseus TaxID=4058 RepID=A0ACC0B733_CATRO|nr:hypothetical protein M9H77_18298 [Catharanthus roseus]